MNLQVQVPVCGLFHDSEIEGIAGFVGCKREGRSAWWVPLDQRRSSTAHLLAVGFSRQHPSRSPPGISSSKKPERERDGVWFTTSRDLAGYCVDSALTNLSSRTQPTSIRGCPSSISKSTPIAVPPGDPGLHQSRRSKMSCRAMGLRLFRPTWRFPHRLIGVDADDLPDFLHRPSRSSARHLA